MIDGYAITKFLSDFDHTYMDRTRPKGPDYLIIDDFKEYFEEGMDVLLQAANEAEHLSEISCNI